MFKPNDDVEIIANRLRQLKPGDQITHEELSRVINRDVTNGARSIVTSARNRLLAEHIRIGVVRGVGYYRMTPKDNADSATSEIRAIGRHARRSRKRIEAISPSDWDALPPESKAKQLAARATLGAVAHFSKVNQQNKLADVCAKNTTPLPLASTLEHFSKKL